MRECIDHLPPLEREVLEGLFYERVGRRVLATRMGIDPRGVARIRDRGIRHLGSLLGIEADKGD